MTNSELIALYRLLGDDRVVPYRFDDPAVKSGLLEAENEAAIRGRLLHDQSDIDVQSGDSTYPLDSEFYELTHLSFIDGDGNRTPVRLVSSTYLDGSLPDVALIDGYDVPSVSGWRDMTGVPAYAIQADGSLRLVPTPNIAGTLHIEGYRTPYTEAGDDPEISAAHHRVLVQWVIYRRFSIPDEDVFDGKRAIEALAEFERYFGPKPDSDLRRSTQQDLPHHVEAFFV